MAVALCAALDRLTNAGHDRRDWIDISRDIEAIVIKVPTGTQDHFPPAFGGAAAIHLEPGRVRREALKVDLDELERRVVVCYTGEPRQSAINNWNVFRAHIDGDRQVFRNLEVISTVAQAMRVALERAKWSEVGRLMREEWSYRRKNLPTITTPVIDRIIAGAKRAGAIAGKVNGAGGGGCVTLLIEPRRSRKSRARRSSGRRQSPASPFGSTGRHGPRHPLTSCRISSGNAATSSRIQFTIKVKRPQSWRGPKPRTRPFTYPRGGIV